MKAVVGHAGIVTSGSSPRARGDGPLWYPREMISPRARGWIPSQQAVAFGDVCQLERAEEPWQGMSEFLCKGRRGHCAFQVQRVVAGKPSSNRIANCPMAAIQSIGRRQRTPALRIARNSNFAAASSLGKLPRVLMILRNDRFRLSRALVV